MTRSRFALLFVFLLLLLPSGVASEHTPDPTNVTIAGSLQAALGCPGDWQPDCLRSWMQDADGDGVCEDADTCPGLPDATQADSDGDGIAEAGETVLLEVDLENHGSVDASGISATLSTATPGVTVVDGTADWPAIASGATATSLAPHFTVSFSGGMKASSTWATSAGCVLESIFLRLGTAARLSSRFNMSVKRCVW